MHSTGMGIGIMSMFSIKTVHTRYECISTTLKSLNIEKYNRTALRYTGNGSIVTEMKSNVVFPYDIKLKGSSSSNSLLADVLLCDIDRMEGKSHTMDQLILPRAESL